METIVDFFQVLIIWDLSGPRWWDIFSFSPQNLFPHSGVFVFFGSHCIANPHLRPQVGGVEVHFDWCFALKHRKLCKNEEKNQGR